jgi:hypothetical protein
VTPTVPGPPAAPARFGPWRREIRAALELLGLTGIAVAQPALDIVSKDVAGVFVTRDATAVQVVAFVAAVVLVPTLVLWAVEAVVGALLPRTRTLVHVALCGLLVAVITIEAVKKATSIAPAALLVVAAVVGIGAAWCFRRFHPAGLFLRYLAVAPFLFGALFLFSSPVTPVVFGHEPESSAGVEVGAPSRVVMVVMDEFPLESLLDGTGHVDATLFPNFAALERGSTWYRNDTTVSPSTETAVPALLTGDHVTKPLAPPVAAEYPHNLFTLLGGAYTMNVHEPYTRLCPKSLCEQMTASSGSGGGVSGMLADAASAWKKFASPEPVPPVRAVLRAGLTSDASLATGIEFVDSLQPATAAQLDFVHIVLPHSPWQFLGSGQDYNPERRPVVPGILTPDLRWRDQFAATSTLQRHLLQVQVADALLGRIVAKLERIGAYDDSLLVVTADHGATFTAGEQLRGLSSVSYPEVMWTPLFVKAPGQDDGVIDDRTVRSIDVLPTIADHLRIDLPWKVDGRSARGAPRTDDALRIAATGWDDAPLVPGEDYHEFDGSSGFRKVLGARAGTGGPDDGLELWRAGPYGALVGARADALVQAGASVTATFDDDPDFEHVDPGARKIPWADLRGSVGLADERRPVAVVVNGVVASVTETSGRIDDTHTAFAAVLPPKLFRRGANDVRLYVVDGPPEDARLVATRRG